MKKLTTISAIALLAFSVTACNKPDPATDYKKFEEWYQLQEKTQATAQAEFQQQLAEIMAKDPKDPEAVDALLQSFSAKVQETLASLEKVDVNSDEIKALKEKTKTVLALSSEVLTEQLKVLATPNDEAQKVVQTKAEQLKEKAIELQKLQENLKAKFASK
ncbi:hypothetical protein A6046_06600 [[Haemophilus] ducreyi]|uniref:Lipoprotein HlpB n=2 Tax=Haemophilus ducreyi TaxID=730 RepID=G1UBA1_HAEDU|nr:hypothetical protein [[Haemophilus] ducreyi]AAF33775.1 HlpB [[Haemophilus] ducreyi]AAP95513.1 lipoprotein HlpB [[Haemophilus] ducreyi 35000HP]AKO30601.1 hypothetical protein RY60_02260 [[Haemophilus] ducreyi]AKO32038.1 hypothetical protein RZ57_02265 [[Haemophilus] ducreyi]AKO33494.1 hypothetical protein RZ58_02270 [[Haemophilus] ducreyi]